jgi:hypothetical protein
MPGLAGCFLALKLRTGNACANTAADHLQVLGDAFAQVRATHRRRLPERGDSAAATHKVLDWLTATRSARSWPPDSLRTDVRPSDRTMRRLAADFARLGIGDRLANRKDWNAWLWCSCTGLAIATVGLTAERWR